MNFAYHTRNIIIIAACVWLLDLPVNYDTIFDVIKRKNNNRYLQIIVTSRRPPTIADNVNLFITFVVVSIITARSFSNI